MKIKDEIKLYIFKKLFSCSDKKFDFRPKIKDIEKRDESIIAAVITNKKTGERQAFYSTDYKIDFSISVMYERK